MRSREFFSTNMQYKKYLLIVEYAEKIKDLINKGYIIFDENKRMIEGEIIIPDDDEFVIVKLQKDNCAFVLFCFAYGDDNKPWIEDTIKEIHSLFRSYSCINPKYMHPVYIKNPKYKKMLMKK